MSKATYDKIAQALALIAEARTENTALAHDAALAELEAYRVHFGFNDEEINEKTHGALLRAIVAGRITFNPQEEVFSYTLKTPVDQTTGPMVTAITIREPTSLELSKANKGKPEEMEMIQRLIHSVSECGLHIAMRLGQADTTAIGSLFAFFG